MVFWPDIMVVFKKNAQNINYMSVVIIFLLKDFE
mgnify:CR=1 FL=1